MHREGVIFAESPIFVTSKALALLMEAALGRTESHVASCNKQALVNPSSICNGTFLLHLTIEPLREYMRALVRGKIETGPKPKGCV